MDARRPFDRLRTTTGEWYLHLFDTSQPDLDWRNPEVPAMFEDVLRFWLDRGVDGFRVDVAHGLFKVKSLRDQRGVTPGQRDLPGDREERAMVERTVRDEPMWDQPEVHGVYRSWRRIIDEYDGDRMAVAEAWTQSPESMARYIRPDELHQAFNFAWLLAPWSAAAFADVVRGTLDAVGLVGAAPTWVLSNHDVVRHVTRYGGGEPRARPGTRRDADDARRCRGRRTSTRVRSSGSRRSTYPRRTGRTLRGSAPEWPDATGPGCRSRGVGRARRSGSGPHGRHRGCRCPTTGRPSPLPRSAGTRTRRGPSTERRCGRDAGTPTARRAVEIVEGRSTVLSSAAGDLTVLCNCGPRPVRLPAGEVVLASGPLDGDLLPPDTAVWLT